MTLNSKKAKTKPLIMYPPIKSEPTLKLEICFCSEDLENPKYVHHKGLIRLKDSPHHSLRPRRNAIVEFHRLEDILDLIKTLLKKHGISIIILKDRGQPPEVINY
jgi:hypothetical protein